MSKTMVENPENSQFNEIIILLTNLLYYMSLDGAHKKSL